MQISFWQRETKQTSDTDLKKKYIKSRLSLMEEDKKSVLFMPWKKSFFRFLINEIL
jgi:hypothetical protein